MEAVTTTRELARLGFGHPQLIFFCELDGASLQALLDEQRLVPVLAANGYGVALAIRVFDDASANVVRMLNAQGVPVIAWLLLSPGEGFWFHLQNYPQAVERYRAFHAWCHRQGLRFQAIGLDIEPPSSEVDQIQRWGLRDLVRRAWLARENVLFAAARAAYVDLIAEIHHDGYEVHTYQLPLLSDDRRAGTTLAQRALDIVDLPSDLEVLICYSSVPLEALGNDLGGSLIASYGPSADGIGVGTLSGSAVQDSSSEGLPSLAWEALERDLLLAARHTDVMYVYSLEGCVERGLLPKLANLHWDAEAQVVTWKRSLVAVVRGLLLLILLTVRFSRALLAWLGWGLAALLLARELRNRLQRVQPRFSLLAYWRARLQRVRLRR